jgi:hypothetical protein
MWEPNEEYVQYHTKLVWILQVIWYPGKGFANSKAGTPLILGHLMGMSDLATKSLD